jgi:AcrR family transcriptional regulator
LPGEDATARLAGLSSLRSTGYRGLTMQGVARRTGTGKAPLYRRWSNKQHRHHKIAGGLRRVKLANMTYCGIYGYALTP